MSESKERITRVTLEEAIVTFNRRDFGAAPVRFGIEVVTPGEALRRIRT